MWSIRFAFFVALCLVGCRGEHAPVVGAAPCSEIRASGAPARIALVLIVSDATRRDRVGAYGGPVRTPVFDAFARDGLLFLNATAEAPWTKPAIATLFTSLHPTQHGVLDHPASRIRGSGVVMADVLQPSYRTLAEMMRLMRVRTAAFVGNPWMQRPYGFDQGFDVYEDSFASFDSAGEHVTAAGLEWLAGLAPDDDYFLYLHYMDAHLPYGRIDEREARAAAALDATALPAEGVRYLDIVKLEDGRSLADLGVPPARGLLDAAYGRGIAAFDAELGRFLEGFADLPAFASAAIIVTADHGEALFERGWGNHGLSLFEDELAIPLAAQLPGVRARDFRVTCPVGLIDLLPTLCDYYEIACPIEAAGRSFLSNGTSERRWLVNEGLPAHPEHRAIRNERYKLIFRPDGPLVVTPRGEHVRDLDAGPWALYDLVEDPDERRDLLEGGGSAVRRVFAAMSAALPHAVPRDAAKVQTQRALSPEQIERLRSLGYLESGDD